MNAISLKKHVPDLCHRIVRIVVCVAGLTGISAGAIAGLSPNASPRHFIENDDGPGIQNDASDSTESEFPMPKECTVLENGRVSTAEPLPAETVDFPRNNNSSDETAAEPNEIVGKVTDDSGSPVAGARVWWFRSRVHDIDPMQPLLVARSDAAGGFSFARPEVSDAETEPAGWDYHERMIIRAEGYGVLRTHPNASEGYKLPPLGESLRGRIVDIDGNPAAGATVQIRRFETPSDRRRILNDPSLEDDELAKWRAQVSRLLNVIEPVPQRFAFPSAVTNTNGEFELTGIGQDWLFQLLVEGPGVQSTDIIAFNGMTENFTIPPGRRSTDQPITVYGNDFLFAVGPSRLVTGVVTDIDSGEPVADAVVRAFLVHGERVNSSRERQHFATRTDNNGRYTISGLPIGESNELVAFTTGDDPYIPAGGIADTSRFGDQVEVSFRLKRGVWAEGRITDGGTGNPFTGELSYSWFPNSEIELSFPGVRDAFLDGRYFTDSRGEFRVPVLPTRGLLAYRWDGDGFQNPRPIDRFPRGLGAEAIEGIDESLSSFPTRPSYVNPGNYNFVLEVNPRPDDKTVRADMTLVASKPVQIQIASTGDSAVPNDGYLVYGLNERWGWQRDQSTECVVEDLKPGESRKVLVFHRETGLGGAAVVHEDIEQPVTIKLVKTGRVKGRLLDRNGDVITNGTLSVAYEKLWSDEPCAIWAPHPTKRAMPSEIPAEDDGYFELDGLIPGWKYSARVNAPRKMQGRMMSVIIGMAFVDLEIEPGETRDLGEVTAAFPNRE